MGESTCLMHGFSYASAIPNESKQGNPIHALGESISFGRFMSESLSWERWSAFSHKKYVEEAERYAQPGSVAQKKAFFEAHYKRIAAQKAAVALLEEEEKSAKEAALPGQGNSNGEDEKETVILNSQVEVEELKIQDENVEPTSIEVALEDENVENQETISGSDGSGTPQPQMEERPLLKNSENMSVTSKRKSGLSSLRSTIQRKTWKVPSTPAAAKKDNFVPQSAIDNKRSSLRELISIIPIKEPDKEPPAKKSMSTSTTPQDCKTPLRTPNVVAVSNSKYAAAATPRSENTRLKTPRDFSATGSKTSGPKWHILSTVRNKSMTAWNKLQSPTLSTPFTLRTEERAAKRKQKLEEKFNADQTKKMQLHEKTLKEKAGNEYKKLSCGFCFKARPLPEFYKEREASTNQMKKITPAPPRAQTVVLGRSISSKKRGNISMPPPPPPPLPTSFPKNLSKKNIVKPTKFPASLFPERKITHENISPNIRL